MTIEQPFNEPTIAAIDSPAMDRQTGPIPYAREDLGEQTYVAERGGPVDRQIDDQVAHNPDFYNKTGPEPFGA